MADAKTKTDRIVVRLEAEDREWIHTEADKLALDDAAFVRMLIRKCRTGALADRLERGRIEARENVVEFARAQDEFFEMTPEQQDAVNAAAMAPGTVDPDDAVSRALAAAEQQGLTQPRQVANDGYDDGFGNVVRPIGERRGWDSYGAKERRRV
jgi:hypothetical protein